MTLSLTTGTLTAYRFPQPFEPARADKVICRRCGDEVGHQCIADEAGKSKELHWRPGDQVMLFYRADKNGGPEFSFGEVLHVNDDWAEMRFDDAVRNLRFRGGNVFGDENLNPHFLFEFRVSDRMIEPTPVFMRL